MNEHEDSARQQRLSKSSDSWSSSWPAEFLILGSLPPLPVFLLGVGPLVPDKQTLVGLVGAAFAFGYLVSAGIDFARHGFERDAVSSAAELFRRRGGALAAISASLYWLVYSLLKEHLPVGPQPPNLFELGAAFAIGPAVGALVAYARYRANPEKEGRYGFALGLMLGSGAAVWSLALWANA